MNTKDKILNNLRKAVRPDFAKPDLSQLSPITYEDVTAQFITKASTTAGATVLELQEGEELDAAVRRAYPDAKSVASNIPGVVADLNPDEAEAQELMKIDVGVIPGSIGVAENACIWIPQTMREKAICFASQRLVILLPKASIVNNMHEAYARIQDSSEYFSPYLFGTFISGPSKTADIESALVYGAQAARAVTIILT